MTEARFQVDVTLEDCRRFAEISGDWNPLHTDAAHAVQSPYRGQVLHGAYSAGLISRLAGMYLPGRDCLLHGMRLKFVAPILPPASLVVQGRVVSTSGELGKVEATVGDAATGKRYVEAVYEFGRHHLRESGRTNPEAQLQSGEPRIVVTGGTGGIGAALLARIGNRALGVSRRDETGMLCCTDLEAIDAVLPDGPVAGIVHCAWPSPDNTGLTSLTEVGGTVDFHVATPLRQIIALAKLLARRGLPDAPLVLVGSTFAEAGRHNYRMPLYSVAKSMVPVLVRILAVELAATGQRCLGVVFDVLEGGMNEGLSPAVRLSHADRVPRGELGSTEDAASQIEWLLANQSHLLSGATVTLSGGALP